MARWGTVRRNDPEVKKSEESSIVIIIVNSIPPYHEEIINVLAVPNGSHYRFRYQKLYIPTIPDPTQIANHDGLIVLRVRETGQFFPVRRITITSVMTVGHIYYISYKVGNIIEISSDISERKSQIDRFHDLVSTAVQPTLYANSPGGDLRNLIFFGTDFAYGFGDTHYHGRVEDREHNSWGNLTEALRDLPMYRDLDFLRLVSIRDELGRVAPFVESSGNIARFALRSRSTYTLLVLQRTETGREGNSAVLSPRTMELTAEPESVQLLQSLHAIAGKYDLYPFIFRTPAVSGRRKYSLLFLRILRGDAPTQWPALQIPIEIKPGRIETTLLYSGAVIFLIGVALFFMPGLLGFVTKDTELVRNLSILLMIVTSNSATRAGLAFASRPELSLAPK